MHIKPLTLILAFFVGTCLFMGCMDRQPAPMCPVPTELKVSDPGVAEFEGVDILVVVDNSNSMAQEQSILATSFFSLVNSLVNPPPRPNWPFEAITDIRIAITTSDMGVSYNGKPYDGEKTMFASWNCTGLGDNGDFVQQSSAAVTLQEGVIGCGGNEKQCPPGWTCEDKSDDGVGVCMSTDGNTSVTCPPSPKEKSQEFVDENWDGDKALSVACLANVGTDGCNFEQQLMAAAAGLNESNAKDNLDNSFMRKKSVTAILVVSDEEDCSLKSGDWHNAKEIGSTGTSEINVVCGRHPEYLFSIEEMKNRYIKAKEEVGGKSNGIVFAAIVGVPPGSECEGTGDAIEKCFDVKPDINGDGTMGSPAEVEKEMPATTGTASYQTYYEYACRRADENAAGKYVTEAYPGTRFVEMAQQFKDKGYVYSICNADWSPAMNEIAGLIAKNMGGSCYGKRLSWDPQTETAGCNVVLSYRYPKKDYATAPLDCPTDDGQVWEQAQGEVSELNSDSGESYWVLGCAVKKLPAPINCVDMKGNADNDEYTDSKTFGWYYCENPGENNSYACKDGLDNDRDGKFDEDDDSCNACYGKGGECEMDCPYKVSLTKAAQYSVSDAADANIVCLQQYRFEDPNCKESSISACTDGDDNDGNGPFDCWSYQKDEKIPEDHFPDHGARKADPDCCPMQANNDNQCQFLNVRGVPVKEINEMAWFDNCSIEKPAVENLPDSCCEAANALLCVLPDDFQAVCAARN